MNYKVFFFIFISIILQQPVNAISEYRYGDSLFVWAKSGLTLRDSTSIRSAKSFIILYGEQITIIDRNIGRTAFEVQEFGVPSFTIKGCWVRVKYKNHIGYVFDGYLSRLEPVIIKERFGIPYVENLEEYLFRAYNFIKKEVETLPTSYDYQKRIYKFEGGVELIEEGSVGWYMHQLIIPNISFEEGYLLANFLFDLEKNYKEKEKPGCRRYSKIAPQLIELILDCELSTKFKVEKVGRKIIISERGSG